MEELKYINDDQIVEDAAKIALERHLQYSNSLDDKPSETPSINVRAGIILAYTRATYTQEERCELTDARKNEIAAWSVSLADKALKLADKKWEAARTLLGI